MELAKIVIRMILIILCVTGIVAVGTLVFIMLALFAIYENFLMIPLNRLYEWTYSEKK